MGIYADMTQLLLSQEPTRARRRTYRAPVETTIPVTTIEEQEPEIIVVEDVTAPAIIETPVDTDEEIIVPVEPAPTDPGWVYQGSSNEFDWHDGGFRNKLLDAQLRAESAYNPKAVSRNRKTGAPIAFGIAQFIPSTWEWAKDMGWIRRDADPFNVTDSLQAQNALMKNLWKQPLIQGGVDDQDKLARMLAAYNYGIGNLEKKTFPKAAKEGVDWKEKLPQETKDYINRIFKRLNEVGPNETYTSKFDRSKLEF